jgi:Uma2 family endonuclease
MTTHAGPFTFTADAFLAWAGERPERFELIRGRAVAMAPERLDHIRAKVRARDALHAGIAGAGLRCEAVGDGLGVRVDDVSVYIPDALVRCGPTLPGDTSVIDDPVIVVEVLSPSTRAVDAIAKLGGYFRLPGLHHYLIVDVDDRALVHNRRTEAGGIETAILREGPLVLDPPGLVLVAADFFPL